MTNTGLLTDRCDPYGIESTVRLFGGVFPDNMMGRYVWYCEQRAGARFRLICTGGDYGTRQAPDGGTVPAYHCDGGHKGVVMPLCTKHQRELATRGYRQPRALRTAAYDGEGHEQHWAPGSIVGGTKANEVCPACAMPPPARSLNEEAGYLTGEIGRYMQLGLDLSAPVVQMRHRLEQVSAELNDMNRRGLVHKCPLRLVEVS